MQQPLPDEIRWLLVPENELRMMSKGTLVIYGIQTHDPGNWRSLWIFLLCQHPYCPSSNPLWPLGSKGKPIMIVLSSWTFLDDLGDSYIQCVSQVVKVEVEEIIVNLDFPRSSNPKLNSTIMQHQVKVYIEFIRQICFAVFWKKIVKKKVLATSSNNYNYVYDATTTTVPKLCFWKYVIR